MESDHEGKEKNRYSSTKAEQQILAQHIRQYFQYQERSEERAQLVEKVKNELVEINPRWNSRIVRLWFNNNRKNYSP